MGDLTNQKKVFEHISKVVDSMTEIALDTIPGGAIIKAVWNYGSELQTSRSLNFLADFQKVLEDKLGRNFYDYELKNQDFHDLFYTVMQEVQKTSSEEKINRFRNILINQIIQKPQDNQLILKYTDLVANLSDIEMLVLGFIRELHDYEAFYTMKDICNKLAENGREEDEVVINNSVIHVRIANSEIKITPFDVEFYVSELINKGLIHRYEGQIMRRPNLISKWGKDFNFRTEPKIYLSGENVCLVYPITGFGYSFINFIESKE